MFSEDALDTSRRWRCFGKLEPSPLPCHAPASYKAPNGLLNDRICYFCEACRPEGAVPLGRGDLYQVTRLAVVLTVPATTMDPTLAARDAQARLIAALDALGATIEFQRAWGEIRALKVGLIARAGADPPQRGRRPLES